MGVNESFVCKSCLISFPIIYIYFVCSGINGSQRLSASVHLIHWWNPTINSKKDGASRLLLSDIVVELIDNIFLTFVFRSPHHTSTNLVVPFHLLRFRFPQHLRMFPKKWLTDQKRDRHHRDVEDGHKRIGGEIYADLKRLLLLFFFRFLVMVLNTHTHTHMPRGIQREMRH